MGEPVIKLADRGTVPAVIDDCRWRLKTFVERDAYVSYDYAAGQLHPDPNSISMTQVDAMYSAMRLRSPKAAWDRFIDNPLDELRPIPTDLDLVDSSDEDVSDGIKALKEACRRLMSATGIAVANSTGVLHLLRPRFVVVAAPCVLERIRVPAPAEDMHDRLETIRLAEILMRGLAKVNASALDELHAYANSLAPLTPTKGLLAGQVVPVRLSKLRGLDILLWTDEMVQPGKHPNWPGWYAQHKAAT